MDLSSNARTYHEIHSLYCASASTCVAGTRAESGNGMLLAFDPAQPDATPRPLIADLARLDAVEGGTCLVSWRFTGFSALASGGLVAHTNVRNLVMVADDAARIDTPAAWRPVSPKLAGESECNAAYRMQIASSGQAVFHAKRIRATGTVPAGTAARAAARIEAIPWSANTWAPRAIPPTPAATGDLRAQHPDACASSLTLPDETYRNTEEMVYASPDLSLELMLADGRNQTSGSDTDAPGVCRWDAASGLFRQVSIPPEMLPENARIEDRENDGNAGPGGLRCQPGTDGLTECLVYGALSSSGGWVYAYRMRMAPDGRASWARATLPDDVSVRGLRVSYVDGSLWMLGGKSQDGPLLLVSTDGGFRFQDASAGLRDILPSRADQIESLAIAGTTLVVGLDEDAALVVYPGYRGALGLRDSSSASMRAR